MKFHATVLHDTGHELSSFDEYEQKSYHIKIGLIDKDALSVAKPVWSWKEDTDALDEHESKILSNSFVKYSDIDTWHIETAYMEWKDGNGTSTFNIDIGAKVRHQETGSKYTIDFANKKQINTTTGYERYIQRELHYITGNNEGNVYSLPDIPQGNNPMRNSNNFLPTFQGQTVLVTKIVCKNRWAYGQVVDDPFFRCYKANGSRGWFPYTLCKRVPESSTTVNLRATTDSVLLPPTTWETGKVGLVQVNSGSQEYTNVVEYFFETIDGVNVQKLERIQSNKLWKCYAAKLESMKEDLSAPGELINNTIDQLEKKWLFHGTATATAPKIVHQGFNRNFSGENGVMYGRGVYFATKAEYSIDFCRGENGIFQMFMCRVAVGDYCEGEVDQLAPNSKPGKPHELFDTTVDDITDPSIFVTHHDAQVYAEYLVTFTVESVSLPSF